LLQLLQQEAHLPSEHFAQELQLVLQHLAQALSAAVAVASPKPAMMASMAPALINVFMCSLVLVVVAGRESFPTRPFMK
jgi:hypothetical protein